MRRMRAITALAATIASACVSVALAAGNAPATPPSVSTGNATNIQSTSAVVNGAVNPNGKATSYAFQWGTTTSYGHETQITSAGAGTSFTSVNASLTGLRPGTTYDFRIIALRPSGTTVVGPNATFKTTGTQPTANGTAPTVTTEPATGISSSGATLSAVVNPQGQATTYYFEYGTDTGGKTVNYGYETAATSAGSGKTNAMVSANLRGLLPGTKYDFRIVAENATGTSLGSNQTLTTTSEPAVTTGEAAGVGTDHATLNGTVNPDGHNTTYYFQYGTTTSYGNNTAPQSAGSGTANVAIHALVSALKANTTYDYRLVATSSQGTVHGDNMTFKTGSQPSPAPTTSQVRVMGRMGFVSPGRVIGVEVGCFKGATTCTGHIRMTYDGTQIGERAYSIAPKSGGFQNIQITGYGERMLHSHNHVFHLLPITVTVSPDGGQGQQLSYVMHLARWVWH